MLNCLDILLRMTMLARNVVLVVENLPSNNGLGGVPINMALRDFEIKIGWPTQAGDDTVFYIVLGKLKPNCWIEGVSNDGKPEIG